MAQFNPKDPRYQRELQREAGRMGPQRLASVVAGEVGARHAGYQLGRQLEFQRLGLASQLARQQHEQFMKRAALGDKAIDLSASRQKFSEKKFKDMLKDERRGLNIGIATGLLGAGYSAYEGKRRENARLAELAQRNIDRDMFRTAMRGNQSFRRGRTDEGALMAERFLGRF